MATYKRKLRAFARIDGQGNAIAGSLITQAKQPKVGKWREIVVNACCTTTTTTTTTTTRPA